MSDWVVIFSDNEKSEPMSKEDALEYLEVFEAPKAIKVKGLGVGEVIINPKVKEQK